jgi:hypothetical protein
MGVLNVLPPSAWSAFTFTSATNLASSSTLLFGAQTALLDVSAIVASGLARDLAISGKITLNGTVPTVNKSIELWAFSDLDDGSSFPSELGNADQTITFLSDQRKRAAAWLVRSIQIDLATASLTYAIKRRSVASILGADVPHIKKIGLFLTHSTGAQISSVSIGITGWDGQY